MQRSLIALAFATTGLACSAPPAGNSSVVGAGNTTSMTTGGSGGAATGGSGGAATGGTGGAVAAGGTTGGTSGAGGASGSAGTGGGADLGADPTLVYPSAGCGMAPPAEQALGSYTEYSVQVTGVTLTDFTHPAHQRGYHVWLPPNYDNTKPYHITYIGYGCGDKFAGATATYKLMDEDPDAIYVGMDMPPITITEPDEGPCYNDDGGENSTEWEYFSLITAEVESRFCHDKNRLYVAGYSSGAWVTNMHACYFSGYDPARKFGPNISVRGTTSVTGGLPDVPMCSNAKVGGLWIHDAGDTANYPAGSIAAINRVMQVNGCTGDYETGVTEPWGPNSALMGICEKYTTCPAEYPVIFCSTTGRGHDAQNDNALPAFTTYYNELDAP
jgi:poly(3-hydroxybutyrate) depolymerase